ncbi:MAG: hypothetical protein WCT07_02805 [Candidatus Paceibacterota bacterium]
MQKYKKYLWYIPALYVSYMFGNKILEGLAHSEEFIAIIGVISPLKPFAYVLSPFVGILDFSIAVLFLVKSFITNNIKIQKYIFIWVILWPFVPASLRYFGGVGEFQIAEVLSISVAGIISYVLWKKFTIENNTNIIQ